MESEQIDNITKQFRVLYEHLSVEKMNRKPDRDIWSIGQNLEYLIRVIESFFPIIRQLHTGTYQIPFHGRIGFVVDFICKAFLKSVQPERKKRIRRFSIWKPETKTPDLEFFEKHRQELKQMFEGCQDLLKKNVVISSPVSRNIVYRLKTVFDIITAHEQRHLEQARYVISSLDSEPNIPSYT